MDNKGNVIGGEAAKQLLGEDLLCDIDPQRRMKRLQSDMSVESCASSASTQSGGDELEGLYQASRNYDDMLGHLIYGGILNKYCAPSSTPRTDPSNLNTPRFSIPSTTPRQPGEWTKHFCNQSDGDWQNVSPQDSIDNTNMLSGDMNLSHALSHVLSDSISVQDVEALLSCEVNDINLSYALQHVLSDTISVQNADALNNMLSDSLNISHTLSESAATPQLLPQLDTQNIQAVKSDADVFKWYEDSIEDALLTQLEKLLVKMNGRNMGGQSPQADMGHYSTKIAESFFSMERGTNGSPTSSLDFRGGPADKKTSQPTDLGLDQNATQGKSALDSLYASVGNKNLKDLSAEQQKPVQLRANAPAFNPNASCFTPKQSQAHTPRKSALSVTAEQLDLPDFIKNAVQGQSPNSQKQEGRSRWQAIRPPPTPAPAPYTYNSFTGQNAVAGTRFSTDIGYTGSKCVQKAHIGRGPPPSFLFDSDNKKQTF
eukprot:TRINITY_DN10210_c0_g2_i1.p1 TRINITY_DN10210_c0_g2~~TRINITY_DN10210_c0_g2_i1.p1  ORF type:complete len:485 (+),score=84.17 TRINITY_DN10210_c0_g2_i1:305-1759(+)